MVLDEYSVSFPSHSPECWAEKAGLKFDASVNAVDEESVDGVEMESCGNVRALVVRR